MRILPALALTLIFWAVPAPAAEPTGSLMGDAFLRTLEAGGYTNARAAEAARRGDTLTLTGVAADAADGPALAIERVALTAPAINADEALTARRIAYEGVHLAEDGAPAATTIAAVTLDNAVLPTVPAGEQRLSNLAGSFDRLALLDLVTPAGGADETGLLTVGGLALIRAAPNDPTVIGGRLVIDRFSFGAGLLDADAHEQLRALGVERLSLDVVAEGRWRQETGRLALDTATVRAEDLGTLAVSLTMDGVTEAAIARFSDTFSNVGELLSALDAASVEALSIAYVDEGLTPKLLARGAEAAGIGLPQFNATLLEALRGTLAGLGDTAFAERTERAAALFLANPGRIAVSATPREPLTLAQVAGVALLRPEVLPALLNIAVEAAP